MTTRRFNPIITATVTPASVSTRQGKNGTYLVLSGATVERNGNSVQRTVMAFGKAVEQIGKLRKGRAIELALQHDGGTMRVVGLPRAAAA